MTALTTEHDPAEARPVLCADEAAALLGISRWLLLQEIKRGNIPTSASGAASSSAASGSSTGSAPTSPDNLAGAPFCCED